MFNYNGLAFIFQYILANIVYDLIVINADQIIKVVIASVFNLLFLLPTLYMMIKARQRKSNEIIFLRLALLEAENKLLKEQLKAQQSEIKASNEEVKAEIRKISDRQHIQEGYIENLVMTFLQK
jgi:hypothetical protein